MSARTDASRLLVLLALALTCIACLAPAASAAGDDDSTGFSVAPLRFDIERPEGGKSTYEQQITIRNTQPRDAIFYISKEDFEGDQSDPDGTPHLLGGEYKSEISGYDWITGYPNSLKIPAGGTKTVTAKVIIPSSASGGHYTALIVAGPPVKFGNATAQSRVAVLFMMDAGGTPPPEIVIDEIVTTTQGDDTTETVIIPVTNEGDTDISPEGEIEYDPVIPGQDPVKTKVDCGTILPGTTGNCTADMTPEEAAKAVRGPVRPSVSLVGSDGEGTRTRADMPTEWAGTWSSLLLPLVGLALFVLYFVFLRRRRRSDDEETPAGLAT